jgi:hypothetical protein
MIIFPCLLVSMLHCALGLWLRFLPSHYQGVPVLDLFGCSTIRIRRCWRCILETHSSLCLAFPLCYALLLLCFWHGCWRGYPAFPVTTGEM